MVEYGALADVVTSWFYLLSSWQWFGGFHREQVVQMRFMLFMKKSSALLALLRRSLQKPRLVLAHLSHCSFIFKWLFLGFFKGE